MPGFALIAEQTLLIGLNRSHVSGRILTIVEPILNQFQVVTDTSAVEPYPVNALNPVSVEPVLL